jgi:hypothetical protein
MAPIFDVMGSVLLEHNLPTLRQVADGTYTN